MGFLFNKPIINNATGIYRTDGLIVSASMLSNISQIYMGNELVYPYTPFSSSGIVAWWRGDQNVVSSSTAPFSWTSSYSNTTSSFTLTGSISGSNLYNVNYVGGGNLPFTGSTHKALNEFQQFVSVDMNNIFTTSSNVTIVMSGRTARGFSNPLIYRSWFGMTGDWNSYIGTSAQSFTNTNYVLKRDEDATPSTWFSQGTAASVVMSLSYNGTTGDYSYYINDGAGGIGSGSRAGATGRLGATQQLRIGFWDGTQNSEFVAFDIMVLDYIPSSNELDMWSSFVTNNYARTYSS
jgi:hypothetical protein